MLLFDISSAFHMCSHRLAKQFSNGDKIDLKEYRKEFFKGLIWILDTHIEMFKTYGEPVVCMDDKSKPSWRKTYYPNYKSARKSFRDSQTTFDYADAYVLFDEFLNALRISGIKVIGVPEAEADDIILVLGHEIAKKNEKVIVLSPDKDFIQLQTNPLVEQYSWFTKKFVGVEDKATKMEEWLVEHICLGDQVDAVPRIVDFKRFKPGVKEFLEQKGFKGTPWEFSGTSYDLQDFEQFGGIWETEKFGPAGLKKLISSHGDLKSLLETDETLKRNFNRNFKLVMREGIPKEIETKILEEFNKPHQTDIQKFADLLDLEIQDLPKYLQDKYINIDNFLDW